MKSSLLSRYTNKMLRQGQPGQAIVIMAFGFIILLGFVGIVTDASLLFVRYNSLRRAVDAAAVAAAGQMRRTLPNNAELTKGLADCGAARQSECAGNYAFARNVANINLAARQFIEFYGLNPINVLVDTCATAVASDPNYADLECGANQQPRKLVRVTAQVTSDTIFMRLLGWGSIVLEASAISESAVLDVVMIFDGSESMLNQTSYDDWDTIGQGMRYLPPRMRTGPNIFGGDRNNNSIEDREETDATPTSPVDLWLQLLQMTWSQVSLETDRTERFPIVAFHPNGLTGEPRDQCRVRFYPAASGFLLVSPSTESPPQDDVQQEYQAYLQSQGITITGWSADPNLYPNSYDGFAPAYNYFGCCNDPNGDGDFSDLICQPFKQVRTATEQFLDRIDFLRGDRVGYVIFDRTAYLVDPDAGGPQTHMITSQVNAVNALRRIVGVRAEPNFYADILDNNNRTNLTPDGTWDHLVMGGAPYNPVSPDPSVRLVPINDYTQQFNPVTRSYEAGGFDNTPLGVLSDYPVKDSCYWSNATLLFPYSRFSSPAASQSGIPFMASRYPTPLARAGTTTFYQGGTTLMHPNLNDPSWDNSMSLDWPDSAPITNRQYQKPYFSYELWAYCGGSNVGAALRVGNNAFQDPRTARANGSVWVMVMLGDGAAAGSDPVQRNRLTLAPPNPYGAYNSDPVPGEYGAYGVCPYGTVVDRSELAGGNTASGGIDSWEVRPPRCMDEVPNTRHFCAQSAEPTGPNAVVDLAKASSCVDKYDVDDFARDWADYIGLADVPDQNPFKLRDDAQGNRDALALPTIFTIGFGLDYRAGTGTCLDRGNESDCLGEELLRYIADVGDNQRIDTDYQQDYLADGYADGLLGAGMTYGERGPCEGPLIISGTQYATADDVAPALLANGRALVAPLPPKQNCGNYYNAPDARELGKVFDDIASRMFTRITQ